MTAMWKPVLEGELADQARTAIRDVAEAVAARPDAAEPADRTLFWAYATSLVDEPFAHAAYDASLDDVIAKLREGVTTAALCDGGLAGIGFTLNDVLDGGAEDVLQVIDEALLGALDGWDGALDLVEGVVGLGVYFTERFAANPQARLAGDGIVRVIDHLERAAIRTELGTTWSNHDGNHDCGVAHGVPGMIAFLSRAERAGEPRAGTLADDATLWLLEQRQSPNGEGRFPAIVRPTVEQYERFARLGTDPGTKRRSRAAWCYGDLGIAAAVWRACPELARETAADCAVRDPATCGVRDTGLCHGAAGLAHLCNRFYQATGQALYADAARAWFARTLAMRRLGGVGGFAAWRGSADDGSDRYAPAYDLLDGAIGTALSLCAAVSTHAPDWDRALLCEA